jgi:hypothetical protein
MLLVQMMIMPTIQSNGKIIYHMDVTFNEPRIFIVYPLFVANYGIVILNNLLVTFHSYLIIFEILDHQ